MCVSQLEAIESCKLVVVFGVVWHSVDDSFWGATVKRPSKLLKLIVARVTEEFFPTSNIDERFEILGELLVHCHVLVFWIDLLEIRRQIRCKLFLIENRILYIIQLCWSVQTINQT